MRECILKRIVSERSLQKQARKFKSESYSSILDLEVDLPACYPTLQGKISFFLRVQIKTSIISKLFLSLEVIVFDSGPSI